MQPAWPEPALHAFSVRMAGHGFSVSSTMMRHDKAYALELLQQAHSMADSSLRELAMELFRHFERQQPGSAYLN